MLFRSHNSVDDDKQTPTTATGGVYSDEAIAPGTTLTAEIRYRGELEKHFKDGGDLTGKLTGDRKSVV